MKTVTFLAALVSSLAAVTCFPAQHDGNASIYKGPSRSPDFDSISNSTSKNGTGSTHATDFSFHLPPVFQLFLNETSNSTKNHVNKSVVESDSLGTPVFYLDSEEMEDVPAVMEEIYRRNAGRHRGDDASFYLDSEELEDRLPASPPVIGENEYGVLVYRPAGGTEEDEKISFSRSFRDNVNYSDSRNGTSINSSVSDSGFRPSVVVSDIFISVFDAADNDSKPFDDESGRDFGDVFYRSGIPAFTYATANSDANKTFSIEHGFTKNESTAGGAEANSHFAVIDSSSRIPSASKNKTFSVSRNVSSLNSGFNASPIDHDRNSESHNPNPIRGSPFSDHTGIGSSDASFDRNSAIGHSSSAGSGSAGSGPAGSASAGSGPAGVSSHRFDARNPESGSKFGVGSSRSPSHVFANDYYYPDEETSIGTSSGVSGGNVGYSSVSSNARTISRQRRSSENSNRNVPTLNSTNPTHPSVVHYDNSSDETIFSSFLNAFPALSSIFVHGSSNTSRDVHRRDTSEFDSDFSETGNGTEISVVASVSSSGSNHSNHNHSSVNATISRDSSAPSVPRNNSGFLSHSAHNPDTRNIGTGVGSSVSSSVSASSSSGAGRHPSIYARPEFPEEEDVDTTTQAKYDEEAALERRQHILELRRQFLLSQTRSNNSDTEDRTESVPKSHDE